MVLLAMKLPQSSRTHPLHPGVICSLATLLCSQYCSALCYSNPDRVDSALNSFEVDKFECHTVYSCGLAGRREGEYAGYELYYKYAALLHKGYGGLLRVRC